MLLITDLVVEKIDSNFVKLAHRKDNTLGCVKEEDFPNAENICVDVDIEIVKAQAFMTSDGKRIDIGISKKVQDTLGLPLDCYRQMSEEIYTYKNEILELRERYTSIKNARFWKRFKFLFGFRIG